MKRRTDLRLARICFVPPWPQVAFAARLEQQEQHGRRRWSVKGKKQQGAAR